MTAAPFSDREAHFVGCVLALGISLCRDLTDLDTLLTEQTATLAAIDDARPQMASTLRRRAKAKRAELKEQTP